MARLAVSCRVEGVAYVALAVSTGQRSIWFATGTSVWLIGQASRAFAITVSAVSVTVDHVAIVA